ncbi:branched-chain amino acid ABC transporter ATP-binding protein [Leptolyngbya sp. 'hensonii']|uniref:tellurite resistance TerB family protein n=1 Tax=Leptolyngbya sp. 'hensonii' TaxID=1922337 RepID=UPI0009502AFF|nr:TerB family tellurite resistance protein [Leptolyngbya sp. 'hensonii']OLP19070.1 branched-chain amino acid ABC transporter ATP-binding protein [Leptolyngbya sp. 'hensonii']
MTPPIPPHISPREMTILRTVCAMAWSDGELSPEEADLMVEQFSMLFAEDSEQRQALQSELQEYMAQNIPLEELIPKLPHTDDRELVLKLGYMVIKASRRSETEDLINAEEQAAYRRLVDLLALPEDLVQQVEWAAEESLKEHESLIHALKQGLAHFFGR